MRWRALDVDYEMAGKDLIDSVRLSGRICRALGGRPPEGFIYELFLDERGEKISKSRGNGLSIEEWLTYAPEESLALFMFQKPKAAKRLYFDVIPRAVDDYRAFLERAAGEEAEKRLENPAWHIHGGAPPEPEEGISFSLLLNLAAASDARDKDTLWGFISRYDPEASPETRPGLDRLADFAIAYCRDFVAPEKVWRDPDAKEAAALADLADRLAALPRVRTARPCRRKSMRSARRMASSRCGHGSPRSTKSCSGASRGRASAPSPRFTGWPRPRR